MKWSAATTMAGNAMHVNAVGTLMMWLLANLKPRLPSDPFADAPLMTPSFLDDSFFGILGNPSSASAVMAPIDVSSSSEDDQ